MIRVVVFDWSGTLSDDKAAVVAGVKRFVPNAPLIRYIFYHPLLRPLRRLLTRIQIHLPRSIAGNHTGSQLFPAVRPVLRALKTHGIRIIILSATPPARIETILHRYRLTHTVHEIHGSVFHKGVFLKQWLHHHKRHSKEVVFISDLAEDLADVHPTGVITCMATWGYDKNHCPHGNAHAVFATLDDLFPFLAQKSAPMYERTAP